MPRYFYPNFPFSFYKNPYFTHGHYQPNINSNSYSVKNSHSKKENYQSEFSKAANSLKNESCNNFKEKNKSNKNDDYFLFDLFGLKIYYDDVLIVSLIYLLYSENVKDDSLFLVLILLLLS